MNVPGSGLGGSLDGVVVIQAISVIPTFCVARWRGGIDSSKTGFRFDLVDGVVPGDETIKIDALASAEAVRPGRGELDERPRGACRNRPGVVIGGIGPGVAAVAGDHACCEAC